MATTTAFKTALLNLYFVNTDHANIGDAAGLQNSATAGSFYISLHTADPGAAGNQTTSESALGGYARVAVARSGAGWTVSGANVSNTAAVTFPAISSGSETITYFGIGSDSSGAGNLFFRGLLGTARVLDAGEVASFAIGELDCNVT